MLDRVTPPTSVTTDNAQDPADPRIEALLRIIHEESRALSAVLPAAYARQWEASTVPVPREDTTERSSGGRPANPTADTALDPRRLAVRAAVLQSSRALREAAIAVRAARKMTERAVARFDGEDLR